MLHNNIHSRKSPSLQNNCRTASPRPVAFVRPSIPPPIPPRSPSVDAGKKSTALERSGAIVHVSPDALANARVFTVELQRGNNDKRKPLGFSIVGGIDSPKGRLPIMIKTVYAGGLAAESKMIKRGALFSNSHYSKPNAQVTRSSQ